MSPVKIRTPSFRETSARRRDISQLTFALERTSVLENQHRPLLAAAVRPAVSREPELWAELLEVNAAVAAVVAAVAVEAEAEPVVAVEAEAEAEVAAAAAVSSVAMRFGSHTI